MTERKVSTPTPQQQDEGEAAAYINEDDVEIVYEDDDDGEDHPMDEDEEEDEEEQGPELVEPTSDSSILTLPHSTAQKSVFTITTHPTLPLSVSGGEDDLAKVWDIVTGELVQTLQGHEDSVVDVAWSADGKYLATAGMDGKIRVWKQITGEKKWELGVELLGADEVVWIKWHPKGAVLLAGGNDGTVWMYQLPSGDTMQVFTSHSGPVTTGTFTPDGKRILTGSSDGSLILWDPRPTSSASPIIWKLSSTDARFGLEAGVISLAVNPSSTLAVVGGAEGGVKVVNLVKGEVLGQLEGHKEGESVESIVFVDVGGGASSSVVVTGGTDGKISVWDLGTMRLRVSMEHSDAISALITHPAPKSYLLTSASADRTLRTWDARTGTLLKEHTGHRAVINGVAVGTGAGGKEVVVSAGDEGTCLVFDTE